MSDLANQETPNQGSSRDTPPVSLQGLYLTLAPVALTAAVYIVIFLVLRRSQRRWYAPRTYLGNLREQQRTPELPGGLFNWIGKFFGIADLHALQHQSLDAYLYLRYLRMTVIISFVGACITWPILFPVNATGGGGGQQLEILSYANVDSSTFTARYRYFAHLFTAWAFFGFVMYLIFRECIFYINLRQAFLLSPLYADRISSRTVLFTSVPDDLLDERKLRKVFGPSAKNVWITGQTKDLDKMVEERDKVAYKLEGAEVKLIKAANKERLNALKKGGAGAETAPTVADAESGSIAARWLSNKKRPTHRTGPLGLLGRKVDSIDWCREELTRLIPATKAAQAKYLAGEGKLACGVFIEFRTQADAETAFQVLSHHQGLHMSERYIGITPGDVVWKSLSIPWWQKVVRRYAVIAFIAALIIFWAIPVAVVGFISNISNVWDLPFLTWLKSIPPVVLGLIQGLLPSVALAILMSLVPIIMRLCAKLAGEPSLSRVELFTQNAYFCFQVVQVFLITTVTSSAASVAQKIAQNPGQVTELLSENLPKASNFYISYFIVQGLGIAANVLSQVVGFVIFTIVYKFLSSTPRKLYQKWANLSAISWGSTMPVYTNITVIAITYAAIAPLVLGFACLGMSLFYLAWRYNVLFVTDTKIDTRGLIYPRALKQLYVGIYLGEICLIGLFGASAAPIQAALMVVFLIFTILFHISMNAALKPLLNNLPQSLLAEEETIRADLEAALTGHSNGDKNGHMEKALHQPKAALKRGNALSRFLKPWVFSDYETMRLLVPRHDFNYKDMYTPEINRDAYYPPSVTSAPPLLWIPEDQAGVSKQEVLHTGKVLPITDEGCILDEKNKLSWDMESTRPPLWEEKILY